VELLSSERLFKGIRPLQESESIEELKPKESRSGSEGSVPKTPESTAKKATTSATQIDEEIA